MQVLRERYRIEVAETTFKTPKNVYACFSCLYIDISLLRSNLEKAGLHSHLCKFVRFRFEKILYVGKEIREQGNRRGFIYLEL